MGFKRQFILGNAVVNKEWKQTIVNGQYFLSTHEELEVNQIKEIGKELTLIGYIINPHKPDNTNIDCLKSISNNISSTKDIFEELYKYGGRFVLIGSINGEMIIVTDPSGLRQVYYTEVDKDFWFASQPNLLAKHVDISRRQDEEVIDFISSPNYEDSQRAWIGDESIYEGVQHLMPNHYFDFKTEGVKRYWINHERDLSNQEAVDKATTILKGSMNAIAKRGNLIQGLTAGWDSRMLLAASIDVNEDVQYYVSLGDSKISNNTDLKIALKLANQLNLNLHVMDNLSDLREEIAEKIRHDVTQGRTLKKTRTIQYFYDNFPDHINVNGNISEIVRNFYGSTHPVITVEYLMKLLRYDGISYVENQLTKWMESVPAEVLNDIAFPDLMYWEQKMGNWAAMQKAEQDIALEDFSPFNNRELLMTLYSVDKKYREPGSYILYRDIMEKLWNDTLSQPINPTGIKEQVIKVAKMVISPNLKRKIKKLLR